MKEEFYVRDMRDFKHETFIEELQTKLMPLMQELNSPNYENVNINDAFSKLNYLLKQAIDKHAP